MAQNDLFNGENTAAVLVPTSGDCQMRSNAGHSQYKSGTPVLTI